MADDPLDRIIGGCQEDALRVASPFDELLRFLMYLRSNDNERRLLVGLIAKAITRFANERNFKTTQAYISAEMVRQHTPPWG